MKYPCGCRGSEGDLFLCDLHSEWNAVVLHLDKALQHVRESDAIGKVEDDTRKRALITIRAARDLCLDFSTPEEPEPPDRETEIEDGEYRPCP